MAPHQGICANGHSVSPSDTEPIGSWPSWATLLAPSQEEPGSWPNSKLMNNCNLSTVAQQQTSLVQMKGCYLEPVGLVCQSLVPLRSSAQL